MLQKLTLKSLISYIVSILLILLLTLMPVADYVAYLKPQWFALIVLYRAVSGFNAIDIIVVFILGLIIDIFQSNLLGANSFAAYGIIFLANLLRNKFRILYIIQQIPLVFIIIAFFQLSVLWLKMFTSDFIVQSSYWLSSVFSALLWPLIVLCLSKLQKSH